MKGIRLVEREQMGKVLNEVELQMSGIFDPDQTVKIGKMTKADILIIGSYGGNENNIILTIKAVDVATGRVLDGKVVQGSSSRIFDMASQSAISMAAVISGNNIGYISISSNPDGADVYIDGLNVGRSPVVDIKVAAAKHTVSVVKENYIDVESTIDIGINEHEKWTPTLPSKTLMNRAQCSVGAYAYVPLSSKLETGPLFTFSMGKTFEHIYLGGEIISGWFNHDQKIDTPFEENSLTHQRMYLPVFAGLHLRVVPFLSWRYFSPYAGIFGQGGMLKSYHKESGDWKDDPQNKTEYVYAFGPVLGINLLPYSKVSIFAEARFSWYPVSTERYQFVSHGLNGAPSFEKKHVNLSGASFGAGLTYYMD